MYINIYTPWEYSCGAYLKLCLGECKQRQHGEKYSRKQTLSTSHDRVWAPSINDVNTKSASPRRVLCQLKTKSARWVQQPDRGCGDGDRSHFIHFLILKPDISREPPEIQDGLAWLLPRLSSSPSLGRCWIVEGCCGQRSSQSPQLSWSKHSPKPMYFFLPSALRISAKKVVRTHTRSDISRCYRPRHLQAPLLAWVWYMRNLTRWWFLPAWRIWSMECGCRL